MKKYLAGTAIGTVLSAALATAAPAATCTVAALTVTCDGLVTGGFVSATADGLTVKVLAGATVTNTDNTALDAIDIDDNNTVTNDGTIAGTGAGRGLDADNGLILTNNGTISSAVRAVDGGDSVVIVNNGTITSGNRGIDVVNGAVITNNGLIETDGEGIELTNDGIVTNAAGAEILALDDAINPEERVTIENFGRIANVQTAADMAVPGAEAQDGIDVNSGTILNRAGAEISSTFGDAIDYDPSTANIESLIDNAGLISGGNHAVENDATNARAQKIINRSTGTIEGKSGLAMNLRGGDDSYIHEAGATLKGGIDFGDGQDFMELAGGLTGTFGGTTAIFDGGAGASDTLKLFGLTLGDLDSTLFNPGVPVYSLSFGPAAGAFRISLRNWEFIDFDDGAAPVAFSVIAANATVVPLPAGLLLLGSGLGLLALARRRRA